VGVCRSGYDRARRRDGPAGLGGLCVDDLHGLHRGTRQHARRFCRGAGLHLVDPPHNIPAFGLVSAALLPLVPASPSTTASCRWSEPVCELDQPARDYTFLGVKSPPRSPTELQATTLAVAQACTTTPSVISVLRPRWVAVDGGVLGYGEAGPRSGVRGRSRGWHQLLCPKRHRERPTELTHPHLDWLSPGGAGRSGIVHDLIPPRTGSSGGTTGVEQRLTGSRISRPHPRSKSPSVAAASGVEVRG
jgi:hypothetical protein